MIVRNETVDPSTLSASETESLISSLYAVHSEIFDGVSREQFAKYVVCSPAKRTRIQLSYGHDGELAGYLAMHAFRPLLSGKECTVLRAEAGLRRAYRGNSSTAGFAISNLLKTKWDFGGPLYYLGCLVHPSSYTIFANNAPAVWPAPGVDIPPELFDLMMQLGEEFHLEQVDPQRPLVRDVGWITRDTEVERRYWQTCDLPGARFYIEQNPGFTKGHGLLTLLPLDLASTAKMVMNTGTSRLRKEIRRTVGSLERNVLRRTLDAPTAEELLQTVEEVTGLDLDSVRNVGVLGTRYPIAARQTLFREGEPSDAMYVVLEGSLLVLGDSPEGELVIDQLGANTLVGELEMMTGQPRATTVRAAIDTQLLRLSKTDLDKLLAAEPRLGSALWEHIHGRVFALLCRRIPRLAQLSRHTQEAWFSAASSHVLTDPQQFTVLSPALLVLSKGKLVVDRAGELMSVAAPALIPVAEGSAVQATGEAYFALLPPQPPSA